MKNTKIKTGLLLLTCSWLAPAEVNWVKQPEQQPLIPTNIVTNKAAAQAQQPAISYNQSLLGEAYFQQQNRGFAVTSKQFWLDTNASQLSKGLLIPLTSETAIIRINPLQSLSSNKSLAVSQLELSSAGQIIQPSVFVGADELKATGMPVSEQTVAFKVQAQPGDLKVKLSGLNQQAGQYVVHVFEPESEHVLNLVTDQQRYDAGADVTIKTQMQVAQQSQAMQVSGYLTNPKGEKVADLSFKADNAGAYQAVVASLQGESMQSGLWEVHTLTEANVNGVKVLRDASTAFAINMPTARFSGALELKAKQVTVGIDNVLPARYEVRGLLYGMDSQGGQQPIALMMSAKWLQSGSESISFDLPLELMAQSGLSAPFTVEQLELKNQSHMTPVQNESQGFQITEIPEAVKDLR